MFNKLQAKWKVTGWQLALILVTFAIGGSLTGFLGRKLLELTGLERGIAYYILYVVVMTLLWPIAIIVVSIPFGQYPFFIKYLKRILGRLRGKSHAKVVADEEAETILATTPADNLIEQPIIQPLKPMQIAIFASGGGSNADKIIQYFKNNHSVKVGLVVTNKAAAGVLSIAAAAGIPSLVLEKEAFFRGNAYVDELKEAGIEFIVLAGFLLKIPAALIKAFPNKIVNIHPALLPKHGGKGMYGHFVHEAVLANAETESGITIHYVDEQYDHGNTIFQANCPVLPGDTAQSLATRVLALEHAHYPKVIADCLKKIS